MITKEWLKMHHACREGILFFERNNLEGFPLSRVGEIEGDYEFFVDWIKGVLYTEKKYENGKLIWEKTSGGTESFYNEYGSVIKQIFFNGKVTEYLYEYDDNGYVILDKTNPEYVIEYRNDNNGNMIWMKGQDEPITEYEYDDNGNEVRCISTSGRHTQISVWSYTYDSHGNITKQVNPSGHIDYFNYEYINNKLHKVYKENKLILEIPEF